MTLKLSIAALALGLLYMSCKKENTTVPVKVLLTDNPTAYEEVNVEIKEVKVKISEDSGWVSLPTNAGTYDLLKLQNGVTTPIAAGDVPDGVLKEIRFILGSNNTIKANGQVSPLLIPSGSESGLKIKIDKDLQETLNTFTLDFDAALSIKEEPDGYKLRPVIRIK